LTDGVLEEMRSGDPRMDGGCMKQGGYISSHETKKMKRKI
jgi:hypothetical protein